MFGSGGLYFNGAHYTTLYVSNNGNVSFGEPNASFTPTPFGADGPLIIAPFFMDLDTRGPDRVSPGGTSQGTNAVYYDLDPLTKAFTATWDDVGYKAGSNTNPAAFQLQLIDMGHGDFDIAFIYEFIGPPATDVPLAPSAGWSLGEADGVTLQQLMASGNRFAMSALDTAVGNTGEAGRWVWHIRNGVLEGTGPTPDPDPDPDPNPDPDPDPDPGPDPDPDPDPGPDPDPDPSPDPDPDPGPDPEPDPMVEPEKAPTSVTFGLSVNGVMREGDSGTTPFHVTIQRFGEDIGSPSLVDWKIVIDDPTDLAPGQALSGTAFFGVGDREVVITVAAQGDKVFEQDDMFQFTLTNAVHGLQVFDPGASVFGIIVNDDSPVMFDFAGPQMRAEGLAGPAPFDFVVIRSGDLTEASTVNWELLPGQANDVDFAPDQPLSGTVSFAIGASQAVIRIQVAGDVKPELDETFTVRLTDATTGSAMSMAGVSTTGTILDDDARHAVLVATPTALVLPEGDAGTTAFAYTLLRTGDVALEVKIPYALALSPGGLTDAEVQSPLSGFVTFAAGSAQAMLTVLVGGDTSPEDNESFLVTLGGGAFNNLALSGVVMNDDLGGGAVAPAAAPSGLGSPVDMGGEPSWFLQNLAGGSLWGGDGGL